MVTLTQLEVLQPVVRAVSVDMMDGFGGGECAADGLGHDQSMFQDVSGDIGVGMFGPADSPVTGRVLRPANFLPWRGSASGEPLGMSSDEPNGKVLVLPLGDAGEFGPFHGLPATALTQPISFGDFGRDFRATLSRVPGVVPGDHFGTVVPVPRKWFDHAIATALASVFTLGMLHS